MANISRNVLTETKFGQKGYVQDEVNNYVDELIATIEKLEKDLESYKTVDNPVEEINKLKGVVESLNRQVKETNDKLTSAQRKNDENEMVIEKLKKSAKNGGYNPELENQLNEKDQEIASMLEKLEQVRDVLVEKENDIATLTDEVQKLKDENQELSNALENEKVTSNADVEDIDDQSAEEIAKLNETISEREETIKSLTADVERLKAENERLTNIDEDELAMTYASNLIKGAKTDAKNILNNAQEKADKTIAEAEELKASADEEVQKVLDKANEEAQATIDGANAQAKEIITNAELESNEKAKAINAQSEQIESDHQAFKNIVMEQIGNINESLASVMELINSASDKVNDAKDKLSNDEPLEELVANLPKAEVVEVELEEVEEPTPVVEVEKDINEMYEAIFDEKLKEDEYSETETETEEVAEVAEPVDTPQNDFAMDGMDALLKAVEDSTPDEVEDTPQYDDTMGGSFDIDGLDDLLKAVEDSTPDEPEEDSIPEPIPSGSAFNMEGLDDLLKAVEDSTPDEEEEEEVTPQAPEEMEASSTQENNTGSGSMEDLMNDIGGSMDSLLESLQ